MCRVCGRWGEPKDGGREESWASWQILFTSSLLWGWDIRPRHVSRVCVSLACAFLSFQLRTATPVPVPGSHSFSLHSVIMDLILFFLYLSPLFFFFKFRSFKKKFNNFGLCHIFNEFYFLIFLVKIVINIDVIFYFDLYQ